MNLVNIWANRWLLDTDTDEVVIDAYEPDPDIPWQPGGLLVIRIPVNSIRRAALDEPSPVERVPAGEPPVDEPTA
ncbi:hypothetical protein [Micromonospora sp. WMMD736]|uniref:hypothetical protein n=1 Tax=Micromonospora sp. WMMD736 TaxID=3404112 RepID=UPI003B937B28